MFFAGSISPTAAPRSAASPEGSVPAVDLGRVRSGDVVLFHDGGGDRTQTVAALEQVLATLSARGYRFSALCRS